MMMVDLILLKNRNFALTRKNSINHRKRFCIDSFFFLSINNFSSTSYFGRTFRVPEVCVSYRLLQTVLFLTDFVFRVLFAYFNASMASKLVYKP